MIRLFARLLLGAFLLQAGSPVWAGLAARAAGGGELQRVEVCTALGVRWIAVDHDQAAGAPAGAPIGGADHHCLFCGGTGMAPLPVVFLPPAIEPVAFLRLPLRTSAPLPRRDPGRQVRAQGPPAFLHA